MPSTSIRRFEYNPGTRVLSVWFVASGRQYDFLDVPPDTYADFKTAFAKGRYFNDRIRNHFAFRPVASSGSSGSC
ncbi:MULTISPECIES: KTSC domain-containing protein [Mesorhizobium]|uniref:KTSC domain-containing protein n=1 Tax=Mesorhizobium TaxID=68287 RepID=UPI0013DFB1C9|nr:MULTISPECIES: KTSC domain-containing protein [Mesorhizobium]MCF6126588.1 KTSC domain-containing protein [Mesorhizobium ciceri]MCQ8817728.1 KTSC domain-containing protein [Mesorhizobium sp. SEMIA396]MCQ8871933.1 KTSC domain-containing protein [Mesorhizobium sp. LMG17149]